MTKKDFFYCTFCLSLFVGMYFMFKYFRDRENDIIEKFALKKIELTKVKIKSDIIDLGKISKLDTTINQDFVIYNTGPNDLYIFDVKPDCKCTGYINSNKGKPVSVKDSTIITLIYKPEVIGAFQVSASVESNTDTLLFLFLRGHVTE